MNTLSQLQFEIIVAWCKRGVMRMTAFACRCRDSNQEDNRTDEESCAAADEDIEEKIEVNNTIVDNELGGREVTVLPSWKKMWDGLKKVEFEPSRWLGTDRAMLNTVKWCGAFLCGMGEHWGVGEIRSDRDTEMLERFFSREMEDVRAVLQSVEWNIEVENGSNEILSIGELGNEDGFVELTGEMSTAYGTGVSWFDVTATYDVNMYSFEFSSLAGSYPVREHRTRGGNRECVSVELIHSVLLAKHLGVEKLKAIRRYYDGHNVPVGKILENAFKLLQKQLTKRRPNDDSIWLLLRSTDWQIPLFPYRMQMVAVWDEATNWRVLQASAHVDLWSSLSRDESEGRILDKAPQEVGIFDYCAEWAVENIQWKDVLGIVIETIRTFLAQWIIESGREPIWDLEVPKDCHEFDLCETDSIFQPDPGDEEDIALKTRLIWVCQRELQRIIAKEWNEDENLPGNAALIMLFILGFPCLSLMEVQDVEIGDEESQSEVLEASSSSSSNRDRRVDVNTKLWRARTILAPQDISLIIQVDLTNGIVSLRLRNSISDARFIWQDWVDVAMGCMKGLEEGADEPGFGKQVVRGDLSRPMVELCPLRVNEEAVGVTVKKTSTARIWMGWPVFDIGICKFEVEQWLDSCDVHLRNRMASEEISRVEAVIKTILSEENKEDKLPTQRADACAT